VQALWVSIAFRHEDGRRVVTHRSSGYLACASRADAHPKSKKTTMTDSLTFLTRLSLGAVIACLGACAAPAPIDVSQSAYLVRTALTEGLKPQVTSIVVENAAPPPDEARNPAFSESYIPVKSNTSETVAADIKSYFGQSTVQTTTGSQKVIARIERADAYWIVNASDKLPMVGLFSIGADHEFYMRLHVSFEVEEAGKVVRTFVVDEKFSIPDGKDSTQASIATSYPTSYQRLIALYRQRLFADLDRQFTARYLN